MKTHELKTWPMSFHEVWRGAKRAEWRKNDRDFKVGDTLHLREYVPAVLEQGVVTIAGYYTGREMLAAVTCVTEAVAHGMPEGYAMLSIKAIARRVEDVEWQF